MLLALAALWGASFMFIKVGVRELEPLTLVGFRMALGALTLVPIVAITVGRRALGELRAATLPLAVTGIFNSALPIFAISWAETRIDSGLTAIIQASAPLFTALLAVRFSQSDRVAGWRLAGLVIGFAGVTLLVGALPSGSVAAGLAVVFSAVCYAASGIYAGRTPPRPHAGMESDRVGADTGNRRHRPRLHPLLRLDRRRRRLPRNPDHVPGADVRARLRRGVARRAGHGGGGRRARARARGHGAWDRSCQAAPSAAGAVRRR
jgi:hypothetical protein